MAALLVAMVLGTSSWGDGCARLDVYRGDKVQAVDRLHANLEDQAARTRADEAFARLVTVYAEAHHRVVPVASATFVLGAALLLLASRALGGRRGARRALVQVVAVHAVVSAVSYVATRDAREAERAWEHAFGVAVVEQSVAPEWRDRLTRVEDLKLRFSAPFGLAASTLASVLVLFALTRPRTRAFLEPLDVPER